MPREDDKITIRVPRRFLQAIDFLVEMDDFPSRSEAVRAALRDFVYGRVEIVTDKIKKMQAAEAAMAEAERTRHEFLRK
jgi:Arc/MetJ-type ribon-helix-helix transcriptional regulator